MTEKMLRCAIYIRVSTFEQSLHGKSLEAQREYLEQYAKEHNMIVAGVYADEGKTARKELKKRKAIHSLLDSVKRREIDVILFWRLDRWFRNLSDFYKVQDILDEYGVKWISTSEPGINMETRDGRLQLNVVLSIGQNEVDTTSERIRFVNEASIRQGKLIFGDANMPLGYKSGIVDGVKRMVKDEEKEDMVNDFFNYFLKHRNKSKTLQYMQSTYDPDFSYSVLRTMLSSEFYKGTYRGIPYCPAYLDAAKWEQVQRAAKSNIKTVPSGRIYYFTGLMNCPLCGQKLVGTGCSSTINRKTREKRTYSYYRCNRAAIDHICPYRHRMSQNLIEEHLLNNLHLEFDKFCYRNSTAAERQKKALAKRTPDKIRAELQRLNMLFQKERISWEYYNGEYEKLEAELNVITAPIQEHERDYSYIESVLGDDFQNIYRTLSPENKRAFWQSLIKEIHLNPDNTVNCVDFNYNVLY